MVLIIGIAFVRDVSSAVSSAPVAFNKSVTASSMVSCPSSHEPIVEFAGGIASGKQDGASIPCRNKNGDIDRWVIGIVNDQ